MITNCSYWNKVNHPVYSQSCHHLYPGSVTSEVNFSEEPSQQPHICPEPGAIRVVDSPRGDVQTVIFSAQVESASNAPDGCKQVPRISRAKVCRTSILKKKNTHVAKFDHCRSKTEEILDLTIEKNIVILTQQNSFLFYF